MSRKYEVFIMHGREVARRKLRENEYHNCTDCLYKANYEIIELDEHENHQNPVWYYCGTCDIGG